MCEEKLKQLDNPFIDNGQKQTVVDMKGMSANILDYRLSDYNSTHAPNRLFSQIPL